MINISLPNMTEPLNSVMNFTGNNTSQAGWFKPVVWTYGDMSDISWLLVTVFTMSIVYIRTNNLPAMAFVALFFSALFMVYMPSLVAKFIYVGLIFIVGGVLWLVFGRK